jgi:hypothetical protein
MTAYLVTKEDVEAGAMTTYLVTKEDFQAACDDDLLSYQGGRRGGVR